MNREDQKIKDWIGLLAKEYSLLSDWFSYIQKGTPDSLWIYDLIHKDPVQFEELILQLSEAIRLLPERPIRFQQYSRIVTQNPFGLASHKILGQMFMHVLSEAARPEKSDSLKLPEKEEEIHDLFGKFNLIYDDLKEQVSVANLYAETVEGYHPMWESAAHTHSVMNIPIRELLKLDLIYPANEKPMVWIIENARIFSSLLDEVPNAPLICIHGNFSLTAKELLDKIIEEGNEIRYAGELIPDGIALAEQILIRYPEDSEPWKMDIESYLKARTPHKRLSEKQLAPLNKYSLDIFSCLKDEMKDQKQSADSEILIDEMISELKYHYQT